MASAFHRADACSSASPDTVHHAQAAIRERPALLQGDPVEPRGPGQICPVHARLPAEHLQDAACPRTGGSPGVEALQAPDNLVQFRPRRAPATDRRHGSSAGRGGRPSPSRSRTRQNGRPEQPDVHHPNGNTAVHSLQRGHVAPALSTCRDGWPGREGVMWPTRSAFRAPPLVRATGGSAWNRHSAKSKAISVRRPRQYGLAPSGSTHATSPSSGTRIPPRSS